MGSKLLGWIVSLVMVFGLTYLFLPTGYLMLVNWFSPVFGANLYVILTEIYVLLGPYTDMLHLSILIGAALVGGLLAGTAKGGIGVAIATLFFGFVLMAVFGVLSFLSIWNNPTALTDLQALVMSPPPGIDIVTIITAPVIGQIIDSLITFILSGFGGGFDISAILGTVLQPIAIAFVVNIILAIIFGAIGGKIGGYLLPKKRKQVKDESDKKKIPSGLEPLFKPDEGVSV